MKQDREPLSSRELAGSVEIRHPTLNDSNDPDYDLRIEAAIDEYIEEKYGDPTRWGGQPFFTRKATSDVSNYDGDESNSTR